MNKIVVITTLVVVSLAVFLIATFIFNPSKISKEVKVSPIISSNYKLDCTGFWEDNPLCVERNNAIRALQELEYAIEETQKIIDNENDLKFQGAKVYKNEGDNLFRDEFYYKAENKYKEALTILNEIKLTNKNKIEGLRNKAIIAYNEDKLNEALNYFEELDSLITDEEVSSYIVKINNRNEIIKLNNKAKELLNNQQFDESKVTIFKSISLDKDYIPSINLKDEILKKEKDFNFFNYINDTYAYIDELNFKKARNSLSQARALYPNSEEVNQVEVRLKINEKENIVKALMQNIDNSVKKEAWKAAMKNINELVNINSSMVDPDKIKRIKDILNFINLADIHLLKPDRLSSKNVFDEALKNYELGKILINNSTPKLANKVSKLETLIKEYSKRIDITFISNNETYFDIERFKNFDPFREFTISVRPGNYTFIAKKPGVEAYRKEVKIKSTDTNKVISVICDTSCSIN